MELYSDTRHLLIKLFVYVYVHIYIHYICIYVQANIVMYSDEKLLRKLLIIFLKAILYKFIELRSVGIEMK